MAKGLDLHLKKGALIETVRRKFGKAGFAAGKIKAKVLEKLAKLKGITGKRARLALSMRKWHHKPQDVMRGPKAPSKITQKLGWMKFRAQRGWNTKVRNPMTRLKSRVKG